MTNLLAPPFDSLRGKSCTLEVALVPMDEVAAAGKKKPFPASMANFRGWIDYISTRSYRCTPLHLPPPPRSRADFRGRNSGLARPAFPRGRGGVMHELPNDHRAAEPGVEGVEMATPDPSQWPVNS
jgi:hypothetical protein